MSTSSTIPTPASPDLVTHTIKVEGKALSGKYQILEISVSKEVNKVPSARITLADGDATKEDFPISNTDDLIPGKPIEILAGYHSKESTIFKGVIARHNISIGNARPTSLIVECKDPAVALTVGRKNTALQDIKDSAAIKDIIGTYSDIKAGTIKATDVEHTELLQYQATDWDFILTRAEANGKIVIVDDGVVSVQTPDLSSAPVVTASYGATILNLEAELDAVPQQQSVKGYAWDYTGQVLSEVEGTDPGISGQGNLSPSKLTAFAPKAFNLYGPPLPEEELQAWADGVFLRHQLAKARGQVTFQGYADVKPGTVIELQGVGKRLNGKNFTAAVHHKIRKGNWLTTVDFGLSPEFFSAKAAVSAPPASGLLPAVNGLQIGKVTQLQEDPDGEDRIQVQLPIIEGKDAVGVWARMASLDAGANRGSFFRPEIDDEVVLGFLNDDPRHAVVIGSLHSSTNPAPLTASAENPQKGFFTREALKLLFDDEKKVISLETPAGNTLTLSDDTAGITLEDGNGNSIVMDADGITLKSGKDLNMEASGDVTLKGKNISMTAKQKLKGKGSKGAELAAGGGNTIIKGAKVMIN
ncbi:MAG: type VI secretion system tip protein VgrG [Bacteroidota bacterium]